MELIGGWIAELLDSEGDEAVAARVKSAVHDLTATFPLYPGLEG